MSHQNRARQGYGSPSLSLTRSRAKFGPRPPPWPELHPRLTSFAPWSPPLWSPPPWSPRPRPPLPSPSWSSEHRAPGQVHRARGSGDGLARVRDGPGARGRGRLGTDRLGGGLAGRGEARDSPGSGCGGNIGATWGACGGCLGLCTCDVLRERLSVVSFICGVIGSLWSAG